MTSIKDSSTFKEIVNLLNRQTPEQLNRLKRLLEDEVHDNGEVSTAHNQTEGEPGKDGNHT